MLNIQPVTPHLSTAQNQGPFQLYVPDTPLTLCCVWLHWPTGLEQEMLQMRMFQVPKPCWRASCRLQPLFYHIPSMPPSCMTLTGPHILGEKRKRIKEVLMNCSSLQDAFVNRKQAPGLTASLLPPPAPKNASPKKPHLKTALECRRPCSLWSIFFFFQSPPGTQVLC